MEETPDKKEIAATVFPEDEPAEAVEASQLVSDDKDRPIADNKIEPPKQDVQQTEQPRKQGRPRLSDEEKAQAKRIRDEVKARMAGKPPPDFHDVRGTTPTVLPPVSRNYQDEFIQIFVPLSMFFGKTLGDHWGLVIDQNKKSIDFTEEQKAYIITGAKWLEYEQWPPLSPRFAFIAHTLAYAGPKVRIEPTPERLKKFFTWIRDKWKKWRGK
jgi:hypothetical protein